ncbi:MAG: ABC transporter [Planctomycetaceae bacterium]|nr:MAG: ABC transporter [Planctomycetaceae bacterium]
MQRSERGNTSGELPAEWLKQLSPDETVQSWFSSEIDHTRRFNPEYVVLTTRKLYVFRRGTATTKEMEPLRLSLASDDKQAATRFEIECWPLHAVVQLRMRDRAGLGTLEVLGSEQRLGMCHYTLAQGTAVLRLVECFEALKADKGPQAREQEPEAPETEAAPPPPSTRALLRLWPFVQAHGHWVLLALLLSLLASLGAVMARELTSPLVDGLTAYQAGQVSFPPVGWYLSLMSLAFVAAWLLGWAQGALLAWVSERVSADLRNATYAHLQKLSLEYFGGKRTGDLMSRLSTDSDRLCQFLSDNVVDFIADVLLLSLIGVRMFSSHNVLALTTLAPFPLVWWVMYRARDRLQRGFLASANAWSQMTSVLADTIPGIRVVKAFAQEQREIRRFREANEHVVQTNRRVNALWTFFWPFIGMLSNLGVLVVWGVGSWLIYRSVQTGVVFTIGELTKFVLLAQLFYGRLESMSRVVNQSQRAAASAQRIFEVLDRVPGVPEPARPVPLQRLHGELEFRHVGFRYGTRKVIHDFCLHIRPGELIGLVGHTGAGKSTLVNLVCRFFDVAEGAILADGVDIRAYRLADYRRNIGMVLQDPFLFYGTIAENIAYGRPDATREEIIRAARAARAHDFIVQLPDGYDSLVGERGQSLSGGERQRISIARALLIDPALLILDEATSAVDTQTEREIQAALQNLIQGRTTIAIAHRLSTLRRADRIVVIERGRIVEIGTHDELLAREGTYAALHRAQQELTRDIGWTG